MESILLLVIPLLSALLVYLAGNRYAKIFAIAGSLTGFGVFAWVLNQFQINDSVQFSYSQPWWRDFGIVFSIGIDGVNLVPLLLTFLIVPVIVVSTPSDRYQPARSFFALILLMQAGMATVFLARGAMLFYLGWEAALIPILFLSGIWGGENRVRATFKFFIYTVAGSLFLLLGLAYLYYQSSGPNRDSYEALAALQLDPSTQSWLFWAIFIAFAIKMPMFPFHTWQPDVYVHSPTPATMLLSGIMLKMGVYGVMRWLLPIVPAGVEEWRWVVILLFVTQVVYGSIIAIKQNDIKRLIAYSSFAHVGLIGAGLFALNLDGLQGATIQMFSHGVTVTGLFLVVEIISRSTGERDMQMLGGLTQSSPSLSVYFIIMLLGSVALPLTSGFIGEFLLLKSLADIDIYLALAAGATIILSAVYMLRMFQYSMLGTPTGEAFVLKAMSPGENAAFIALAILVFWIGIYPSSFTDLVLPSLQNLQVAAGR